jgi:hypothetical protein
MDINSITRRFNRSILVSKKQSPHIFFAAGVIGAVTSTVLACRATLKLSESLDKIKTDVDNVHALNPEKQESDTDIVRYPTDQYRKDLGYVYGKAALEITKLYGPSIVIGVASIGALTGSHVQLTRRNSALMAAYAAVQQAYLEYRERVKQELGPERELDIYHAASFEVVENADGKKEEVKVVDPNKYSPYARFFDEYSQHWEKDPELNRLYIQCQQNYANNLLQARGHLFLNEVYDMLGVDRSKAGAVVGWVISDVGDNYVDFGIYEAYNGRFVNGFERSILLDFNVDGVIYDKI